MKKFSAYSMIGLTDEDNEILLEAINEGLELTVDNLDRVYNEAGTYIADIKEVEDGFGLL